MADKKDISRATPSDERITAMNWPKPTVVPRMVTDASDVYRGIVMRICSILEENGVRDIEDPADALELLLRSHKKWEVYDNPWYAAITDACVINHIDWSDSDARLSLAQLVAWETQIALDPAVSKQAQDLVNQGRKEYFATSLPAARVPDGFVLVPEIATAEMEKAGAAEYRHQSIHRIYEAMLAAAPDADAEGKGNG